MMATTAKLTPKQEKFCLAYIETGNASEAYRQAYDSAQMKEETINKRASELLANGVVAGRLAEVRKVAADKAIMTLESHLADLKMLRNAAAKDRKWASAVAAEVARGKHSGVAVNKMEVTGADGAPLGVEMPSVVVNFIRSKGRPDESKG